MSGTVQRSEGAGGPQAPADTERFGSLLASGERVLLLRRRHWFTFVDAGRWFVLVMAIGIAVGLIAEFAEKKREILDRL